MRQVGLATNRRKILAYSVAIWSVVVALVCTLAIYSLYTAAFEQTRRSLIETADAQARLIGAIAL